MGTERAYYQGLSESSGEIREIRFSGGAALVVLDRTIFYPESGGQAGDRGWINRAPVLDTQEEAGEILHRVSEEDAAALRPGKAALVLDTARRRDFTAHHTAQHLLSGIILRQTGARTASMRLGEQVCTIDVEAPSFPQDALFEAEEAAAAGIEADHPVSVHLCPPENLADFPLRKAPPSGGAPVRVVEIQGQDFSPCCGTHLASTGQIGILRILKAEKYKGMTRISFIAGRRALNDSRMLRREGERISRSLKVPVPEISGAVAALLEKAACLERRLAEQEAEGALRKARDLVREKGHEPIIAASAPDAELSETLRIGRVAQTLTNRVILLGCPSACRFAGFCADAQVDLRRLLQEPMKRFGGKGGGSASLFQGQFPSSRNLEDFMRAVAEGGGAAGEG
ncbi:MAG: alanyl-tRNA editing protein [Spirochaetaceae bacterium]|jgi:alanyl-tRNA synthetase|nr:alanyl-tRNA editing protein [Spirochaetaceae bacterium]